MDYKFRSISDTPTVKEVSHTANVLIEEEGSIKRTPVSCLNGDWDLVIIHTHLDHSRELFVESGSYQNVYRKIMTEHKEPKILVVYQHEYGEICYGVRSAFNYADIIVDDEDTTRQWLEINYYTSKWSGSLYVTQDNEVTDDNPFSVEYPQ